MMHLRAARGVSVQPVYIIRRAMAMLMLLDPLASQAERVRQEVLDLALNGHAPIVIVQSPPGAGKTDLIALLIARAHDCGKRVAAVNPRANQAFDLVRRLLHDYPSVPIELLLGRDRDLPPDLANHPDRLLLDLKWRSDDRARVEVATVAKLRSFVAGLPPDEPTYDLLICEEAYQVSWSEFAPFFHLVRTTTVLVGDPGQLPPLVTTPIAPFEAAAYKVHWPVPKEVLRQFPDTPCLQLPVTWRLPHDTTHLIAPSFYHIPFQSAVPDDQRHVHYAVAGPGDTVDRALDLLAAGNTIVGLLLPERQLPAPDVDPEVTELMAFVMDRLLARGVTWTNVRRLPPGDIGCIDPHVASGASLRTHIRQLSHSTNQILCDTSERYQGLQRPILITKHPLSGRTRLDSWVLEPGRFCVALSRHLLGCIIVGRAGRGGIGAAPPWSW